MQGADPLDADDHREWQEGCWISAKDERWNDEDLVLLNGGRQRELTEIVTEEEIELLDVEMLIEGWREWNKDKIVQVKLIVLQNEKKFAPIKTERQLTFG